MPASGRTRTFLDGAESVRWPDPHRGLPPPRPREHRVSKSAGTHVNVARATVDEFVLRLFVAADEVEEGVVHLHEPSSCSPCAMATPVPVLRSSFKDDGTHGNFDAVVRLCSIASDDDALMFVPCQFCERTTATRCHWRHPTTGIDEVTVQPILAGCPERPCSPKAEVGRRGARR